MERYWNISSDPKKIREALCNNYVPARERGTTLQWLHTDQEARYLEAKKKGTTLYEPSSFQYKYNSMGWRCPEIDLDADHSDSILFIGCSNTFGVGVPMEHTWAYQTHQKLGAPGPYINLASGGQGVDFMSRTIYNWTQAIKPKMVVVAFSDIGRVERFFPESPYLTPYSAKFDNIPKPHESGLLHKARYTQFAKSLDVVKTLSNDMHDVIRNVIFADTACQLTKTKFVWTTWSGEWYFHEFEDAVHNMELLNDVGIRLPHFDTASKLGEYGRDGWHPGLTAHSRYADLITPILSPLL